MAIELNWSSFLTRWCGRSYTLVVQWLRIHLPRQGMQSQSLVKELKAHMTQSN